MNNNLNQIFIPLGLLILVFIIWNLISKKITVSYQEIEKDEPFYQGQQATTVVYNSIGQLNYKMVARRINYFSNQQITQFIDPTATIFDKNRLPSWIVEADNARLTKNKMLYLYGHVQISNLIDIAQIKHITVNNAVINLTTQDIFSEEETTLQGSNFSSTGMQLQGNLLNKVISLIGKVRTFYEA